MFWVVFGCCAWVGECFIVWLFGGGGFFRLLVLSLYVYILSMVLWCVFLWVFVVFGGWCEYFLGARCAGVGPSDLWCFLCLGSDIFCASWLGDGHLFDGSISRYVRILRPIMPVVPCMGVSGPFWHGWLALSSVFVPVLGALSVRLGVW